MAMRRKLGEILVEMGACTQADVDAAIKDQRGGASFRIGDQLLESGKVTPMALAEALSKQNDLPFTVMPPVPAAVSSLVPVDFQVKRKMAPFKIDIGAQGKVHVAVADPVAAGEWVEEMSVKLKRLLKLYVTPVDELARHHATLLGAPAPRPSPRGALPVKAGDVPAWVTATADSDDSKQVRAFLEQAGTAWGASDSSRAPATVMQEVGAWLHAQGVLKNENAPPADVLATLIRHLTSQGVLDKAALKEALKRVG
ncbi:MAG: hypothetical protein K1X64_19610 [Myxococcaceae bacterium]|nr:hypothetical protein [Myxococcaceae bacterium]